MYEKLAYMWGKYDTIRYATIYHGLKTWQIQLKGMPYGHAETRADLLYFFSRYILRYEKWGQRTGYRSAKILGRAP